MLSDQRRCGKEKTELTKSRPYTCIGVERRDIEETNNDDDDDDDHDYDYDEDDDDDYDYDEDDDYDIIYGWQHYQTFQFLSFAKPLTSISFGVFSHARHTADETSNSLQLHPLFAY